MSQNTSTCDTIFASDGSTLDLYGDIRRMRALNSRPPSRLADSIRDASQCALDVTRLRVTAAALFGPGRLSLGEVRYYRLTDGDVSPADAARYVGKGRQAAFHQACNSSDWLASVHDKALFQTVLHGGGFRTPDTLALIGNQRRAGYPSTVDCLKGLPDILSTWSDWPLIAKPVTGMFSVGVLKINGADRKGADIEGVGHVLYEDLALYMRVIGQDGYLLQRWLAPERVGPTIGCGALPTIRMLVLREADGPWLAKAVLKIPGGGAVADNYWRPGNLIASVDVDDGLILRAWSGMGESLREHSAHPETGVLLNGAAVPSWTDAVKLVLDVADCFPGVHTQSWDIALTADGPLALEMNFGGDLNLHQIAYRSGVLSPRYAAHLRRHGVRIPQGF